MVISSCCYSFKVLKRKVSYVILLMKVFYFYLYLYFLVYLIIFFQIIVIALCWHLFLVATYNMTTTNFLLGVTSILKLPCLTSIWYWWGWGGGGVGVGWVGQWGLLALTLELWQNDIFLICNVKHNLRMCRIMQLILRNRSYKNIHYDDVGS